MSQSAIPTKLGEQWNAQSFAGQVVSPITHMAFGDGDGPLSSEALALENEVYRTTLSDHGVLTDQTASYFDGPLPAGTNGFLIREVGLFTADGDMVAVGKRSPGLPKEEPDDFTYQFLVFFERLEALVVTIDPQHGINANRKVLTDTGLGGGGDLSADRTLVTNWSNLPGRTTINGADRFNIRQGDTQRQITLQDCADWIEGNLTDTVRTDEEIQDMISTFLSSTGASVVYDDAGNALSLDIANASQSVIGLVRLATEVEMDNGSLSTVSASPLLVDKFYNRIVDFVNSTFAVDSIPNSHLQVGSGQTGYVELEIPAGVLAHGGGFSFDIELQSPSTGNRRTYSVSGYVEATNWNQSHVHFSHPELQEAVTFNYDSATSKAYVYVNHFNTTGSCLYRVRNFLAWANNTSLRTSIPDTVLNLVANRKGITNQTRTPPEVATDPVTGGTDITNVLGYLFQTTTNNATGPSTLSNLNGTTGTTWTKVYSVQIDDTNNGTNNTWTNTYKRTA